MSKFFINRPIVAMVIAILTVIVGAVTITSLPVAQFPNIVPPEIQLQASYVGADAQTLEQSRRHAYRTANQWRGQRELHVLPKRHRQLPNHHGRGLRPEDGPEHRSHPHTVARATGCRSASAGR